MKMRHPDKVLRKEGKAFFMKCEICGTEFRAYGTMRHFCSKKCYRNLSVEERFWQKVDKNGPVPSHVKNIGNCWIWKGCCSRAGGYGDFTIGEKFIRAHRFSWELHFGKIPEGKDVLHKCDQVRCTRPDHLFLGTDADNVRDRVKKGRSKTQHGEENNLAKLTERDILAIRAASERVRGIILSEQYKVSYVQIRRIIRREAWTHI